MKTDNNKNIEREQEDNAYRESENALGPHGNMRPDKFPESMMSKDQRKDTERTPKTDSSEVNDSADIESLAEDTAPTVGSRVTGSNPDDIAGVADLDRGMRRAKRR